MLGAGYAYGAITTTNNQYTGCLLSGNVGNVAIGSTPTKPCQNPAVQISWNQTGSQGNQGPAGPQGPQGVTGARGEVGATGAKGQKGDTGPPGAPGAKGDTGANGAPGVTGATGPSGPIGATGPPGSSPAAGTSCQTGEFVVGFDATGAISCGVGSPSGGGATDTDADGRPDSLDPCPTDADTIVNGVRYCPATVYEVNDGSAPAGSAVCLADVLITGLSGTTATLAVDPGDPGYLGAAGSTIGVDFSGLPPTPSASHRVTVCGTVLVGPAFSPTQVTVLS